MSRPKGTHAQYKASMRALIEDDDDLGVIAGLQIIALNDPDVSATALVYQALTMLEGLEETAEAGAVHAQPTREERKAEIGMLRGLYETMLDRSAETYVATQECTCADCMRDAAPMN